MWLPTSLLSWLLCSWWKNFWAVKSKNLEGKFFVLCSKPPVGLLPISIPIQISLLLFSLCIHPLPPIFRTEWLKCIRSMKVTKCKNIEAGKGRGRGWVVVGMGESEGRRNEISRYEVKKRYNEPARGVTKAPVRKGRTRGVQALVNAGMTRGGSNTGMGILSHSWALEAFNILLSFYHI